MRPAEAPHVGLAVWAAIIVAVTLLGRWAFSVDTHAQEGGGSTPTVTPTTLLDEEGDDDEEEKREDLPDCTDPGTWGYPECSGYRTPTPTRTPTATPTNTAKPTETPTPTNTPTRTPTGYPTDTPTRHPTDTPTGYPTDTPTRHPTDTPTPTPTGTRSPTPTPTRTRTPTPTPTKTPVPSFSAAVKVDGQYVLGDHPRWSILDIEYVRVEITVRNNAQMSDYVFQLDYDSARTGLYRHRFTHPQTICPSPLQVNRHGTAGRFSVYGRQGVDSDRPTMTAFM